MSYSKIILHIPHASKEIPAWTNNYDNCDHVWWSSETTWKDVEHLEPIINALTDTYTDELFAPPIDFAEDFSLVQFPYSRVFCDVERLINDPLEKQGLGIVYDWVKLGGTIHQRSRFNDYVCKLYLEHNYNLQKALTFNALLLDCHSFSSKPNVLCSNPPQDIDICIGYNDDATRPSDGTLDNVEQYLTAKGYRVARNKPFSNSKTVEVPFPYHSLMIEVNKSLYMDEDTEEQIQPAFDKLRESILGLFAQLNHSHVLFDYLDVDLTKLLPKNNTRLRGIGIINGVVGYWTLHQRGGYGGAAFHDLTECNWQLDIPAFYRRYSIYDNATLDDMLKILNNRPKAKKWSSEWREWHIQAKEVLLRLGFQDEDNHRHYIHL